MGVRTAWTAVAAAVAVAAGAFAAPASAADAGQEERHRATRRAMEALLNEETPGITAQARDRHGEWNSAAGLGDLDRRSPRGAHDHYRVGSITKTFVATVLLQLEAEGRLDLDDKVGRWLPGVVEGNGHDGDRISVRRLLNHTSGIYDVSSDPWFRRRVFSEEFLAHRYDTWTPEQHVAIAMRHKRDFEPGRGWKYSNTNYILAVMIIEKVTGTSYADQIERRVIRPLGLSGTSVPGTGPALPEPSSRAYAKLSGEPGAPIHDLTLLNPSVAGASGGMISDSADLNRFYSALLRGRLLPRKQLAAMKTAVPKGDDRPGESYGLGLQPLTLSCSAVVWGNGGDIHGSSTAAMTTEDGRHSLAVNVNAPSDELPAVIDAEFCGKR